MGLAALVLLAWVAAAVPDACPSFLGMATRPPDLFVGLTAYLALRGKGTAPIGWGIALGAAKDCLSLDPLGTHAFVLGTVALLFARREGRPPLDGLARTFATTGAACLAGWIALVRVIPYSKAPVLASSFVDVVPSALFTALLTPPLFALLDRTRVLDGLCGRSRALAA